MLNWMQKRAARSGYAMALGAGALLVATWLPVAAADGPGAARPRSANGAEEIDARYRAERTACEQGRTGEDTATCLHEAVAARDAARRGQLEDGATRYDENARARCNRLQGDDARDCQARVRGEGLVSGSVRGGGILRETVTIVVGPVPAATPPSPTP